VASCVLVPAKINLWLEVLRKRDDGYHELSTLMLPVAVADELRVELHRGEEIRLLCDADGVPGDRTNLAWRAAEAFMHETGWRAGVTITLRKNIPVAAGLGGGSADAAGVLLALNRMQGNVLSRESLQRVAVRLGADVPFFLDQRPALATGIGEKLTPVSGVPNYPLIMVKPQLSIATAWVYQSLKLTRGECRINVSSFLARPWRLEEVMENDLESVTLSSYPVLLRIKAWLRSRGAVGTLMSGSGPTIYGIFRDAEQARKVGLLARNEWDDCWVLTTEVQGDLSARS
jgi:4-diphosphocytidyl-2-C-methyl-D-erythritol kinase